ncbi:MAG: hypothetical protein A3B23_00675 [Candidatus Colwellbacteria bacterium RIFCSPLOWO2_01_FULL_48_10]|uniref:Probable peptidoglycan glycosyltransferase FtsW n=1 Tax=Candidatus Colwellbacteria bacterium RIFCSPLOWO2_01_FULL_48_10 TaxID=1797690 RepID=A0A1G1Z6V8_9BACT|nr:MAG: hypothetical protein A3B23_00675 [Candidatus Colwellbacteria bacterium RIFCSPLOWO2_01_FULL_48_10]
MRQKGKIDYFVLSLVIILIAVGIIVLASASSDLAKSKLDEASYYITHQLIYGLGVGMAAFLFGFLFPYQKYKRFAPALLAFGVGMLLLTFTPLGFTSGGATRWITLGFVTVQPAEILKFVFVIYLAAWLSKERSNRQTDLWKGFVPFAGLLGIVALLLLSQRSTSSVVIIAAAALAVYFVSGAKWKYIFSMISLGVIALTLLIALSPYRLDRFKTFVDPGSDTSGSSYQIDRALISIGSGGFLGVGYGNSLSKKYLPERIGDSIFAIIAEEFGFVGASAVIAAFLFLVTRGYLIAQKARDPFGRLIMVGFSTIIATQAFMHMAAISGIIPLTGVPLPFISYGGTALAIFMAISGVMLNISRKV